MLDIFPRMSLFQKCVVVPGGFCLRRSEVVNHYSESFHAIFGDKLVHCVIFFLFKEWMLGYTCPCFQDNEVVSET